MRTRPTGWQVVLAVAVTASSSVLAQDPGYSPPPLVPASEPSEPPPPPPPPEPQGAAPKVVDRISNREFDDEPNAPAPLAVTPSAPLDEPPGRAKRIAISLAVGAGSGAVVAVATGFAGSAVWPRLTPSLPTVWTGAALGFAVAAPVAVLVTGLFFDGDGAWWATLVGDLTGCALGALATIAGSAEGVVALFALPLFGSVIGYEATSVASKSAARVGPTVTLLRNGGAAFGLSGTF